MVNLQSQYDVDDVAWSSEQVQLLRERRWSEIDLDNIIEEIEDVGGRHRDALESQLEVYLLHRLKQIVQPEKASRSWENSIRASSKAMRRAIKRRPSLRRHLDLSLENCYENAREDAAEETGLDLSQFPQSCPARLKIELETL